MVDPDPHKINKDPKPWSRNIVWIKPSIYIDEYKKTKSGTVHKKLNTGNYCVCNATSEENVSYLLAEQFY